MRSTRCGVLIFLIAVSLHATIFGGVRGVVRDPDGTPVAQLRVTLRDAGSAHAVSATTDANGAFSFAAVPIGTYRVVAVGRQLASAEVMVTVRSGATSSLILTVIPPKLTESVTVTASSPVADVRSATTQTTVNQNDIVDTPGAERPNSVAMITQFVPGSYVVHDQLHVRGGHQVDWLIDGVPVPNTNIATNVGPQFDPKDVDVLEVQRGGYSAEYGDRTFAVFNVVPRTGFDRDRDADVTASFGSQRTANAQFRIGDHSERFAWYVSANGNRTDAGLETPTPEIVHDRAHGFGAFTTLVALPTSVDQLRAVASWRRDDYEVPGSDDAQRERDAFVNLSWVRVVSPSALLTVSPFFHQNLADFDGAIANDYRDSRYAGAQATFANGGLRLGAFGFTQRDDVRFALPSIAQRETLHGNLVAIFAEDSFDASWLTVRGGLRATRFSGALNETAVSPRLGATARVHDVVLRASYGQTYQAPPLSTVSGPLLQFAIDQGFAFLPLRGERDRQSEIGAFLPLGDWTVDAAAFRTEARNFFDHDVLGNSNIFFPVTIDRVHIRGVEMTVRSSFFHLAWSHQKVEGEGAIAGGLTDFEPAPRGRYFLDHDQRDTLAAGVTWRLPHASWIAANVNYGSGFLDGDGPAHLPSHTTFDLGTGTTWNAWTLKISATNVANKRYLLDESNTFGGTHFIEPRQVSLEARYRFRY